jgi:ABC-2 type transport system permease protein
MLHQREMDHVLEAIKRGVPALVLVDPLPAVDMRLAPAATMAARVNPYKSGEIAVAEKNVGDVQQLARALGVTWSPARIAWDSYRPHPELSQLPREVIFVGPGNGNSQAFNSRHAATAGLQELVLMYPGHLEPAGAAGVNFEALVSTGRVAGSESYFELVQPSASGPMLNGALPHESEGKELVLAAHVRTAAGDAHPTNVIVVADLDFISDQMFELRTSRPANASFDNIMFFLNCLDVLAGDESLVALRTRRVKHRTLERVEAQTRTFLERRMREEQDASTAAEKALESARNVVKLRVGEIQSRADLDPQAKMIMARNLQETENRRLAVLQSNIEIEKNGKIRASRESMETELRRIEGAIRTAAVALPPVPMACLGLLIFVRRRRRERRMAALAGRTTEVA